MNSTTTDPAATEHIKINNNNNNNNSDSNKQNNKIRPTTDSHEDSINNSTTRTTTVTTLPAAAPCVAKPVEEFVDNNDDCKYDIETDTDIPYALHNQESVATGMSTFAANEEDELEKRTDIDEEEFSSWNNVGSENFSEYSGEEQENNVFYAEPFARQRNMPAAQENELFMSPEERGAMPENMNCNASAVMLGASPSSAYNMQYPCPNQLAARTATANTHVMLPNNIPAQISSRLQNHYPYGHRPHQHHQMPYSNHHPPPEPSRIMPHLYTSHPNMWYPNAPFGHYRGYGRQQAFAHHPDHMLDMFQLSNR